MEIFNLFASACSIVGLFVSLFVATSVHKLSKVDTGDNTTIQNGNKNIHAVTGDNSVVALPKANVNYHITKTEEKEPPVLTEQEYSIIPAEYDKYKEGISSKTCNMLMLGDSNNMRFVTDFSNIESRPEVNRWIGFAVKSLPMYDWRSFVNEDYRLEFSYIGTDSISNIWIELTNKQLNKKIYKKYLELSSEEKKFSLPLGKYKNQLEDWKSVDEICFVFFPEECVRQKGSVFITDLVIKKN